MVTCVYHPAGHMAYGFVNWKTLNVGIYIFAVSFQAVESADNGYVTEPEGKNGEEGEAKINNGLNIYYSL